jgi:tyrosine-protein kinase Etk/Wzc
MINKIKTISSGSLLKELLKKAWTYKTFYVISVGILVTFTFFYNKFSHTVYEVYSSILVNDNERSVLVNSNDLFKSGTQFIQNNKNIENELGMISSFSLVSATITSLNLEVGYFQESGNLIKQSAEIYDDSPFTVNIDKSHVQPIDVRFYVDVISDSTYLLTAVNKKTFLYNYLDNDIRGRDIPLQISKIFKFNQPAKDNSFSFSLVLNKNNVPDRKSRYYFQLYHQDYLAMQYLNRFKISAASPLALIINISYSGENLRKITAFLNKYMELYLNENLEKKNKTSVSTIEFIDSQISQVSDSLITSESDLRNYRQANQVTDLSFQGQRIYDQMTQIETERANLMVQKRYYDYILDYFEKNPVEADVVPPSSMNVTDPIKSANYTAIGFKR